VPQMLHVHLSFIDFIKNQLLKELI